MPTWTGTAVRVFARRGRAGEDVEVAVLLIAQYPTVLLPGPRMTTCPANLVLLM